ncbi:HEPN domain-containing protein [Cupriavidus basilensis]|uniref:ApeA N-terminal domain 1-containing protein n=1 Tax=Cupriavidus basilensis TaxID=68895 RepID=UPI0039F674CD
MILTAKILDERGYFWWRDEAVPKGHFAPDGAVTGVLSIDSDGTIRLELDGSLASEHDPWASIFDRGRDLSPEKAIQGKLKDSNRNVLLLGLRKNGGQVSSNGISYERFLAMQCLVSERNLPPLQKPLRFDALEVDLKGLEEWLRIGNIETTHWRSRITAKHRLPKPDVYRIDGGVLTIRYEISGPWANRSPRRSHTLTLVESATISYAPTDRLSLSDMQSEYSMMQDLFILLTGCEYALDWPRLKVGKTYYDLYFPRHRSSAEPPAWSDSWTNFVELQGCFGEVFSAWRRKRNEFGPGFYLYLGTRRGLKLYIEHRFVNLIWGLESLHRRKGDGASQSGKLQVKIERILRQVEGKADRAWLAKRLQNAGEPALHERIYESFSGLRLGLDSNHLRKFSEDCARRRNDISHFGGQRHDGAYKDFLLDVAAKADAVAYLYHALLLQEIGVDAEIIKRSVLDGPQSFPIKHAFRQAGLLPPESASH